VSLPGNRKVFFLFVYCHYNKMFFLSFVIKIVLILLKLRLSMREYIIRIWVYYRVLCCGHKSYIKFMLIRYQHIIVVFLIQFILRYYKEYLKAFKYFMTYSQYRFICIVFYCFCDYWSVIYIIKLRIQLCIIFPKQSTI
jgi:hypothetical protein